MREHPLLLKDRLVRAILEDRKWQTRRLIRDAPAGAFPTGRPVTVPGAPIGPLWGWIGSDKSQILRDDGTGWLTRGSYGEEGDFLWVREAWKFCGVDMNRHGRTHGVEDVVVEYRDGTKRTITVPWQLGEAMMAKPIKWRPGIHMFRQFSRLLLEVKRVRVERLQAIAPKDAVVEGLQACATHGGWLGATSPGAQEPFCCADPVRAFASLWDSINAKRPGASWAANPWVWAIDFKRVQQ